MLFKFLVDGEPVNVRITKSEQIEVSRYEIYYNCGSIYFVKWNSIPKDKQNKIKDELKSDIITHGLLNAKTNFQIPYSCQFDVLKKKRFFCCLIEPINNILKETDLERKYFITCDDNYIQVSFIQN